MKNLSTTTLLFILVLTLGFASMACNCPKLVRLPETSTTLTVKRQCDLKAAVQAGKYDQIDPIFAQPNSFPVPKGCVEGEEVEVHLFRTSELVHYPCKTRSDVILYNMNKRGYRAVDWTLLLSLGAKFPELQRQTWIVGLASKWWDSEGHEFVPSLSRSEEGQRLLDLSEGEPLYGWCDGYFAATRM